MVRLRFKIHVILVSAIKTVFHSATAQILVPSVIAKRTLNLAHNLVIVSHVLQVIAMENARRESALMMNKINKMKIK